METNTLDSTLISENKEKAVLGYASTGKRFLNSLIDGVIIYLIFFVFVILLQSNGSVYDLEGGIQFSIYLFMLAYFIIMEGTTGKTIGKYLTKTKVITEEGEKPTMKTALIRTLCRFIPFEGFSFLSTPCHGWHDSIAKSRVVDDK